MYNGIGLQTARGSGTNGYVQRNMALIRNTKNKIDFRTEEELQKLEDQRTRGPNAEIREHARKRALELKCAEMEDVMREQGYSESEVEQKVGQFRAMLMERDKAASRTNDIPRDQYGRPKCSMQGLGA
ncbi:SRRM2 protein homolog rsr-2-like [Penaeus indicus]|uniref:SRRM2 protein homolog rsr-2-like n=1 Tax=Penaeus indicus TaxID=29960 RepID=UPI00300DB90B